MFTDVMTWVISGKTLRLTTHTDKICSKDILNINKDLSCSVHMPHSEGQSAPNIRVDGALWPKRFQQQINT